MHHSAYAFCGPQCVCVIRRRVAWEVLCHRLAAACVIGRVIVFAFSHFVGPKKGHFWCVSCGDAALHELSGLTQLKCRSKLLPQCPWREWKTVNWVSVRQREMNYEQLIMKTAQLERSNFWQLDNGPKSIMTGCPWRVQGHILRRSDLSDWLGLARPLFIFERLSHSPDVEAR